MALRLFRHRQARARSRQFVPRLESLEQRDLPSQLSLGHVAAPTLLHVASTTTAARAGFEQFVRQQIAQTHLAGVSVVLVRGDQLLFADGFGAANIRSGLAMTPATPLMLASVSKTVTAVAAMQLVESGKLNLDQDIDNYLPFAVRNPRYPDVPITLRMLLTHTSSISDNDPFPAVAYSKGDSPIRLSAILPAYLTPSGQYYDPGNFLHARPGSTYQYCNIGVALVGYLVEVAAHQPFDLYCRDHIFRPLGMRHTNWKLAGLNPATVAMPYEYDAGRLVAQGQYGFPDYPDGQLRSSALDMSRFLRAFMNDGALDGTRILSARSVAEMRRVQFPQIEPSQGLVWYYDQVGSFRVLGHMGSESGVDTIMFFRPRDRVGVLVFSNTDAANADAENRQENAIVAIGAKLFGLAH